MAVTQYTRSIADDTLNGAFDNDSFMFELSQTNIIPAIDHVNINGDVLDYFFKDALSTEEESTFDSTLAAHEGIPPAKEPAKVIVTNQVEIDKGRLSFDTIISHNFTDNTSWPATDNSVWLVEPSALNKKLEISKAEIQFTHDIKFKSSSTPKDFYYDVWVFNPLVDMGETIDPDDPTFIPGVSSGNPLRFLYKRYVYKSLMDVFNYGNSHYSMTAIVDGLASGVTTVQFDYDQILVLKGSEGTQIRFSVQDHVEMESGAGESFFTISMVVRELDL